MDRLPRSPRRCEAGFTLVETLVVLSILAMTMSVAPAIMSGLAGARLRAATDELIAELRETRAQAVRRDDTAELVLDLAQRRYARSGLAGTRPLAEIVDVVEVVPARLAQSNRVARLRFRSDGTADEAHIILRHGDSRNVIGIDWLTGMVRRDE